MSNPAQPPVTFWSTMGSIWSSIVSWPIWSHVIAPGLVAALVTTVLYLWMQRPRADLQMIRINQTIEVAKWLARAENDEDPAGQEAMKYWKPRHIVLVTNHGDGAAYDVRFAGSDCRPRVYIRDTGQREEGSAEVVAGLPMWSDRLGALEAGEKWSVVVMSSPDNSKPPPVLEVSWARLPKRRVGRVKRTFKLADANIIETGWPGKANIA